MILELTPEHESYRQRIERFAADRVAPQAATIDELGAFPRDLVREAAALGVMGVTIPAAWVEAWRGRPSSFIARSNNRFTS